MSNRLAKEIAPSVATLEKLAELADYSLMDTLNCEPDGAQVIEIAVGALPTLADPRPHSSS